MAGRTLIIGADSLIGSALQQRLRGQGVDVVGTTRRRDALAEGKIYFDLARAEEMMEVLPKFSTMVLCSAVNGFAACRQAPELSWRVNVEATQRLATSAVAHGAQLIFLSSSAVFDGSRPAVRADEPTRPRNEYGRQKAEAERRVLALGEGMCVVRLTKVVSPDMPLISRWADDLARGRSIRPFTDLPMAPIAVDWVSEILARIIKQHLSGVWQLSASRDVSYAQVAQWLAERMGGSEAMVHPQTAAANGIPAEEIPQYSTLDCSRLCAQWGIQSPEPQTVMDDLFSSRPSPRCPLG